MTPIERERERERGEEGEREREREEEGEEGEREERGGYRNGVGHAISQWGNSGQAGALFFGQRSTDRHSPRSAEIGCLVQRTDGRTGRSFWTSAANLDAA